MKKTAEYIRREDAIKAIEEMPNCYNGFSDTYDKAQIIGELEEIPSADVVERKHGKWIEHIEEDYIGNGEYGYIVLPKCSVCGSLNSKKCHFCPNCGAEMR